MFYLQPQTSVICDVKISDFHKFRESQTVCPAHGLVTKSQHNTEHLCCWGADSSEEMSEEKLYNLLLTRLNSC